jgi:hypothetical protein
MRNIHRSTQDNLENPLHVDPLKLPFDHPIWKSMDVVMITKEAYDLIAIKNPYTLYIITNDKGPTAYLGIARINLEKNNIKYLIGPDKQMGEYAVYMVFSTIHGDHLIEICRYRNLMDAAEALNQYTRAGSHNEKPLALRRMLISYIERDIQIHDLIVNVICMLQDTNHPQFQEMLSTLNLYNVQDIQDGDLPMDVKVLLHHCSASRNVMFKYYAALYDILVMYDFFREKKYTDDPDNADLHRPIERIMEVFEQ